MTPAEATNAIRATSTGYKWGGAKTEQHLPYYPAPLPHRDPYAGMERPGLPGYTGHGEEDVGVPANKGADPKGSAGAAKLPLGTIPWAVVLELSLAMGEGATKYGPHNWRESENVEMLTYVAAAMRHLTAFMLGEDIDRASNISHITKAMSSLMVLRDAQINGKAFDNRAPAVPQEFLDQLQGAWAETRALAEAEALRMKLTA